MTLIIIIRHFSSPAYKDVIYQSFTN